MTGGEAYKQKLLREHERDPHEPAFIRRLIADPVETHDSPSAMERKENKQAGGSRSRQRSPPVDNGENLLPGLFVAPPAGSACQTRYESL